MTHTLKHVNPDACLITLEQLTDIVPSAFTLMISNIVFDYFVLF